ncbi:MAG: glycosyltransferase family 4 protein [Caldilineaceae bacterium]|nr:glycosyltransferase family 4 protein [Caldilineaceae bacterium]
MQIGIDASRALRATRTGTERYAYEIIRHILRTAGADRHDWRLYVDEPVQTDAFAPADGFLPARVNVEYLAPVRGWTHRALGPALLDDGPDTLFVPAHVLPLAMRQRQAPAGVVTIHDLGYRFLPQAHSRRQRWYLELGTRWSARQAERVICVSRSTAQDLHAEYGTPWRKIEVIYEAAAPPPLLLSPAEIQSVRREWGLTRPFALYVGTLQPRKNLLRLIDAFTKLAEAGKMEHDLVLAGNPGWLSEPILARIRAHSLAGRIHLPGYVSDQQRGALLQAAAFFCFPSLYEGFGLPVLEAQQIGVPVMTSNNSSLPEVAGDAALLIDPTDVDAMAAAMLRLSRDEALRADLIAAGYENVKRFSWDKAAAETLAVLEAAGRAG